MAIELVVATRNADKQREIHAILGGESSIRLLSPPSGVADVAETGATLEENARLKAESMAGATGRPAMADDTGLEVEALGGAPGVHSARFAGENATYDKNVVKLLRMLEGHRKHDERRAVFRTVIVVSLPDGRSVVVEGAVHGHIAAEPRGASGFGYDPVFVPAEGDGRTFAEMTPEQKDACSHRGRALRELARRLDSFTHTAEPSWLQAPRDVRGR